MNYLLKNSIFYCFSKLGLLTLLKYKNRKKLTVLALHGVMANHDKVDWAPLRPQLHPEELERTLTILSENYQFVDIKQCIDMLRGELPMIDNAILITFDDGYRNNIKYALPICQKFLIKPILFVSTGHIDSGEAFWFDRLDYALQQNMGEIIFFKHQGVNYRFDATSRKALKVSYKLFRDRCKSSFTDDEEMNKLFLNLSEKLESMSGKALSNLGSKDDWSSIVSWNELREAVKSDLIDIGSHTVKHLRLDCIPQAKAILELKLSKQRIESELKISCDFFCYPNGDYNDLSTELTKNCGYQSAFCTDIGLCKKGDDLMKLKRFNFPSHKTKSGLLFLLNSKCFN